MLPGPGKKSVVFFYFTRTNLYDTTTGSVFAFLYVYVYFYISIFCVCLVFVCVFYVCVGGWGQEEIIQWGGGGRMGGMGWLGGGGG